LPRAPRPGLDLDHAKVVVDRVHLVRDPFLTLFAEQYGLANLLVAVLPSLHLEPERFELRPEVLKNAVAREALADN
jgi:hypothetical protein